MFRYTLSYRTLRLLVLVLLTAGCTSWHQSTPLWISANRYPIESYSQKKVGVLPVSFASHLRSDATISRIIQEAVKDNSKTLSIPAPKVIDDYSALEKTSFPPTDAELAAQIKKAKLDAAYHISVYDYEWGNQYTAPAILGSVRFVDASLGLRRWMFVRYWQPNIPPSQLKTRKDRERQMRFAMDIDMISVFYEVKWPVRYGETGIFDEKAKLLGKKPDIFVLNPITAWSSSTEPGDETGAAPSNKTSASVANFEVVAIGSAGLAEINATNNGQTGDPISLKDASGAMPEVVWRRIAVPLSVGDNSIVIAVSSSTGLAERKLMLRRYIPATPERVLVIGVDDYSNFPKIHDRVSAADAVRNQFAVKAKLQLMPDVDVRIAKEEIEALARASDPAAPGLIYFAGRIEFGNTEYRLLLRDSTTGSNVRSIVVPKDLNLTGQNAVWIVDACAESIPDAFASSPAARSLDPLDQSPNASPEQRDSRSRGPLVLLGVTRCDDPAGGLRMAIESVLRSDKKSRTSGGVEDENRRFFDSIRQRYPNLISNAGDERRFMLSEFLRPMRPPYSP